MNQVPILTPDDLRKFMEKKNIPGEILSLSVPTPTVIAAADAVGTHPDQIAKSILFLIGEEPVLAISCGTTKIDRNAIANRYLVGKKRVRLVPAERVLELSGYSVGAMPPFGHTQEFETLIDPRLLDHDVIYAGGGAENVLLLINPSILLHATHGEIYPLNSEVNIK